MKFLHTFLISGGLLASAVTAGYCEASGGYNNQTALGTTAVFAFDQESLDDRVWTTVNTTSTDQGLGFPVLAAYTAPNIVSNFFIYHGRIEVWWKSTNGSSIISAFGLKAVGDDYYSGGNAIFTFISNFTDSASFDVQTFNTTTLITDPDAGLGEVDFAVENTETDYHNYTLEWTEDNLQITVDSNFTASLDPSLLGASYPLAFYAASVPNVQGTNDGDANPQLGYTTFDGYPMTAYIKNLTITDYSAGASNYGYVSGSDGSCTVQINPGVSNVTQAIESDTGDASASSTAISTSTSAGGVAAATAAVTGAMRMGMGVGIGVGALLLAA